MEVITKINFSLSLSALYQNFDYILIRLLRTSSCGILDKALREQIFTDVIQINDDFSLKTLNQHKLEKASLDAFFPHPAQQHIKRSDQAVLVTLPTL